MIQWINSNEGFCMFVITVIYVIATALICFFNGKSAKAASAQLIKMSEQEKSNQKEFEERMHFLRQQQESNYNIANQQLEMMKKEQEQREKIAEDNLAELDKQLMQNIGLQLYEKRKAVLEALRSVDLKKAFYDIKLLFSNEIFEDYMRLCKKHEEYQHTLSLIDQFKQNIRDLFSQEEYDEFEQSEVLAATNDNYEQLYQESKEYIITKEYEQYSGVLTIDYEEESKKAIALHGEIQDMLTKLYHKIENFIKASISL